MTQEIISSKELLGNKKLEDLLKEGIEKINNYDQRNNMDKTKNRNTAYLIARQEYEKIKEPLEKTIKDLSREYIPLESKERKVERFEKIKGIYSEINQYLLDNNKAVKFLGVSLYSSIIASKEGFNNLKSLPKVFDKTKKALEVIAYGNEDIIMKYEATKVLIQLKEKIENIPSKHLNLNYKKLHDNLESYEKRLDKKIGGKTIAPEIKLILMDKKSEVREYMSMIQQEYSSRSI